ncbi:MAG: ATP-binding protein [Bacteriovoracia bacterium]
MSSTRWNSIFKGIRFRLTFVYSSLFGIFILAFAYITSLQHFQSDRQDFDSGLFNYAIDLSEYLYIDESGLKIDFKLPESEVLKAFPFLLKQTYYNVRNYEGKILAKSHKIFSIGEIPFDPSLPKEKDYTYRYFNFKKDGEVFRGLNMKIINERGKEMILQVATSQEALIERERNHLLITMTVVIFLIMASSFFSYLIAGRALLPIKSLTDAANKIAAQNLSLRVPDVNTGDEVEELAKTLNKLLDGLEKSWEAQENFVANASHQLNTPLAIIKGELDVLESRPRTPEENARFHVSLREELERLIDLVKKMLMISRVESGLETSFSLSWVRLDDLLLTTSGRLRSKAKEKKINLRFNIDENISSQDLEVLGEKQLLDTVFENIIENAIKYSPPKSTVFLDIKKINDHTEVWIQDEGPGIMEEEFKKKLTTRFERGPGPNIPGTGIGLPIAHKIAQLHKARITYKKRTPTGSLFMVTFPPKH